MKRIGAIAAIAWLLSIGSAAAQETITVAWDPNPEPDIAGYTLYAGTTSGVYTSAQWVGNVTQRTMTFPPGRYFFVLRATNIYGMESPPSAEVSTTIVAQPPPVPNWQALWHNTSTGQFVQWEMAGPNFVSGGPLALGQISPTWKAKASADFNGDGQRDILFQHDQGGVAVWLMNGNALLENRLFSHVSDTNWQIVAAADFNEDSHTDIIWHHRQSGDLVAWIMNGTTFVRGVALSPGRVADTNWRVIAAADFNGDSRPDLLWQHVQTGVITSWLMNGTTMAGAGPFSLTGSSDPQWRITGVADVNDDGRIDLLWQHQGSHHIAVWYMNGRTFINAQLLTPSQVPPEWSFRGGR